MGEVKYRINFGYAEVKQFNKIEDGRLVTYGYSIHRDRNGIETHRTGPTSCVSVGWDNGTPFTESDYNELKVD